MNIDNTTECPVCRAASFRAVIQDFNFPFVTSDCRPWRGPVILRQCNTCDAITKQTTPEWRASNERIYSDYRPYHQGDGSEQKIQAEGLEFLARSDVLTGKIAETINLADQGTLLDVGCGNGVFLRSFARQYPGWKIVGNDLGDRYKAEIESISEGAQFISGPAEAIQGQFDFVSLVHALEHFYDPQEFVRTLAKLVGNNGTAFVQVPNVARNPFDLMIYDHAIHFTPNTLHRMVSPIFSTGAYIHTDWNSKEISLLARSQSIPNVVPPAISDERANLEAAIRFLQAMIAQAKGHTRRPNAELGIFGTSIAGTWLGVAIDEQFDFYVDEDEARIGRRHLGKRIVAPDSVPQGACVLLPLLHQTAENIQQRFQHLDIDFRLPPPLEDNS